MTEPTKDNALYEDLLLIYQKLDELREPSFPIIFRLMVKVFIAQVLIGCIIFLLIAFFSVFFAGVFGGIILGWLNNLIHSFHFVQPYNFVIPFLKLV